MLLEWIRRKVRTLLYEVQERMYDQEDERVERGKKHKRFRFYLYNPAQDRSRRLLMLLCGAALAVVFIFSASQLIGYGMDYARARRASNALRQAYYEPEETSLAVAEETPLPTDTPAPTAETVIIQPTDAPQTTSVPAATAQTAQRLPEVKYPGNPYAIVSTRFQKLKRQNQDIVGWLTIDGMIDEAVVQRNNSYYLDRDYLGYHNVNGAIFLDENCDLRTRPYTLMLYGHNMKSGLMFGGLRNYENPTYYHNNPFITFDTAYENGRYVVFSVATISLDAKNWRYVNLAWLISSSVSLREKAISSLNRFSLYHSGIDVNSDDQLLMLITCVDEKTDRRIITARRIRDDENEEELHKRVRTIRLK